MKLLPLEAVRTIGLAGTGSVGTAWAALFLAGGYRVVASDPAAEAEVRTRSGIDAMWPALVRLGIASQAQPPADELLFVDSLAAMAAASDLVQENAPEAPAIKGPIVKAIDAALPADRLILSSSGGVRPTDLQKFCDHHPERLLLGHPFHPAHIVPLVEVEAGEQTDPDAVDLALAFYKSLKKHPIRLNREMVGHLTNRLQFALLREAAFCLAEGVASATDIDATMRLGLGPRWALMGGLMTLNLAGGDGGIASLLDRFGNDVQRWWDDLSTINLTPEVRSALVQGAEELKAGHDNREWGAWRDEALIDFFAFTAERPPLPGAAGYR